MNVRRSLRNLRQIEQDSRYYSLHCVVSVLRPGCEWKQNDELYQDNLLHVGPRDSHNKVGILRGSMPYSPASR